ncbi:hypothetical protein [Ktedonobacter racemifer]|uniref:Uncharacterized protein n=1 Tax=Ktedonobacter racemifer DSM 44963 TaxID=485913 RepID=D6TLE8_KTERA|nr:hypothetical protein [Ktedonobacter racemifer]EFH86598.1 hypothetical protein Krac_7901 [Ktedonobacter racemifer DSM 44963]
MYGVYHVLDELAESVRLLSHDVANKLAKHKQGYLAVSLPIILAMLKGQNKTLEEVLEENVKAEKPRGKEEKLEKEFGAKLTAQGIPVQYQVRCEHGRADIVTPDAIYEIKASLSRSTLHKAIAQVLLYRDCINPSAKAVVVGYPHRKEKVDVAMANRLNVEVIVCEESV